MNDKYATLYFELAAMFADCDSELDVRVERHRITDIVTQASCDRVRAIIDAELQNGLSRE
jgi:hypothetical protein